jgi:hypothetical protein
VIIVDMCSSTIAAEKAAVVGCALNVDVDPMLAQRALSGGVAATPLNSAL